MLRIIFILALLLHGIGHALFAVNAWGLWKTTATRPAIFVSLLHAPQSVEGVVGFLWLLPLIGFVAASWGLLADTDWWDSLAFVAALLSLALTVIFWNGIEPSSAFLSMIFNVVVIAAVQARPAFLNLMR